MILGRVVGHGTSTVKHRSLRRMRMLVVEPIGAASLDPILALDRLGAGAGDIVVLSSDGIYTRHMVDDNCSPARWWVMCICDQADEVAARAGRTG
jgi:ethanolamine utilization protein EutN